jgi:TATA-binding protein-associated factor Taf7
LSYYAIRRQANFFRNDVHLDRLKIAYVRVPEPADYFLPSVRTNENAIESETANPDNALESEASKPNQADQHTSSSPAQPVRPNLRRTTRIRKRPVRFRGSSFNSEGSSSDGQTLTESDSYFKIKRVLTQRIRNDKTEYQVQFKGEPAQNSIWIPFDQLNAYTQRAVRNKPPPRVE